jgi:hypothetical protein
MAMQLPVGLPPAPLLLEVEVLPPDPEVVPPLAPAPLDEDGPAAPLLAEEPPVPPLPSVSPSPAGSSSPQPTNIASPLPATLQRKSLRDHRFPIMPLLLRSSGGSPRIVDAFVRTISQRPPWTER